MILATAVFTLFISMQGALPTPVMLWKDVAAGESVASVKAKYPAQKGVTKHWDTEILINKVTAVGECLASSRITFDANGAEKVTLEPDYKNNRRCKELIFNGLVEKYGTPITSLQIPDTGVLGQDAGQVMTWQKDGLAVRLKLEDDGIDWAGWKITYRKIEANNEL